MNDNTFSWSLNKRRFVKISSRSTYYEHLGCLFDSEWHIRIQKCANNQLSKASRINPFENEETTFTSEIPVWAIFLEHSHNIGALKVNAKFILGRSIYHSDFIVTDHGGNSIFMCKFNTKFLNDYNFDIILTFEANADSVNSDVNEIRLSELSNLSGLSKLNDLSNDLQYMLEKEHLADVILECHSTVLRAHKCVLSARSPVFEAMFSSPMQESKKDVVDIDDMDTSVLRVMVSFMYSGQVKALTFPLACDLLYAAKKYEIRALEEGCVDYLKSVLSKDNIFKILEVGDLYDKQLKANAVDYICGCFSELKLKKEWQIIKEENPVLAVEIYSHLEENFQKSM